MKKLLFGISIFLLMIFKLSFGQTYDKSEQAFKSEVAILPFDITITGNKKEAEAMKLMQKDEGYAHQNKFYSMLLNKKKLNYNVQDIERTNALLLKSRIDIENIKSFTTSELAKLLGVDKVVKGKVSRTDPTAGGAFIMGYDTTLDIALYGNDDKLTWKFNDNSHSGTSSDKAIEKAMKRALNDIPL